MADETKIEWADSTFNPWEGCTKISDACDNCYAADRAKRFRTVEWGNHPRRRLSDANWRKPRKWNREAEKSGKPHFVFCASLADVFDNQVPTEWRRDLWELIGATPHLTWLLLTKRPQNIARMLPNPGQHYPRGGPAWGDGWPNVWLGTTVEHQEAADRNIPALLAVPAARRFLSCEPLLGPVDIGRWLWPVCKHWASGYASYEDAKAAGAYAELKPQGLVSAYAVFLDWVIAGGESGPNARPSHPDWFRSLRDQCADAGTPFLFKQWGEWFPGIVDLNSDSDGGRWLAFPDIEHDPGADRWEFKRAKSHELPDGTGMLRIGKVRTGRFLDGVEHNGRPEA